MLLVMRWAWIISIAIFATNSAILALNDYFTTFVSSNLYCAVDDLFLCIKVVCILGVAFTMDTPSIAARGDPLIFTHYCHLLSPIFYHWRDERTRNRKVRAASPMCPAKDSSRGNACTVCKARRADAMLVHRVCETRWKVGWKKEEKKTYHSCTIRQALR